MGIQPTICQGEGTANVRRMWRVSDRWTPGTTFALREGMDKRTNDELAASKNPEDQKKLARRLQAESRKLDRQAGRPVTTNR